MNMLNCTLTWMMCRVWTLDIRPGSMLCRRAIAETFDLTRLPTVISVLFLLSELWFLLSSYSAKKTWILTKPDLYRIAIINHHAPNQPRATRTSSIASETSRWHCNWKAKTHPSTGGSGKRSTNGTTRTQCTVQFGCFVLERPRRGTRNDIRGQHAPREFLHDLRVKN